jgi:hypothetical protein
MHGENVENAIKMDKKYQTQDIVMCTLCPPFILKLSSTASCCLFVSIALIMLRICSCIIPPLFALICSYLIIYKFSEIARACVFVEFL